MSFLDFFAVASTGVVVDTFVLVVAAVVVDDGGTAFATSRAVNVIYTLTVVTVVVGGLGVDVTGA